MEFEIRDGRRGNEDDLSSYAALCSEKIRALEAKEVGTDKLESGIRTDKAENRKKLSSPGIMCMEKTRVAEAIGIGNLEVEPGTGAEQMETVEDTISPKASFLEKNTVLEAVETEPLKMVKPEKDTDSVSCKITCLENGRDLGPVTPFPDRENVELSKADVVFGCRTPSESIFDPFAPGPEVLMFAPKKKVLKETRLPLRRQLNFDICSSDSVENEKLNVAKDVAEEELFLESVYEHFLDMIVKHQIREISVENLLAEPNLSDSFETPTSSPSLTGITDTCPPAPMRPSSKSRKISLDICRKLEF